jgi:hypothetical protein
MPWSYGFATHTGAIHGTESPGQDYCACKVLPMKAGGDVLIAAVSDGAGNAESGGEGARIACEGFCDHMAALLKKAKGLAGLTDDALRAMLDAVVQSIQAKAASLGRPIDEFSCTLVAAVATESGAIFMQIGDGAAVYRSGDEFQVALWPESSEYVNTTYFVTRADAQAHFFIRRIDEPVEDVALFTDGLQYMVLDVKSQEPHQPFFGAVTKRLCDAEPGYVEAFAAWLLATLKSPQVTGRTDDDTSLLVAKRRPKK